MLATATLPTSYPKGMNARGKWYQISRTIRAQTVGTSVIVKMDYNLPKSNNNNNNNNNFVQLYIFYNMFSQQKNLHSSNFIQIFQLYVKGQCFTPVISWRASWDGQKRKEILLHISGNFNI